MPVNSERLFELASIAKISLRGSLWFNSELRAPKYCYSTTVNDILYTSEIGRKIFVAKIIVQNRSSVFRSLEHHIYNYLFLRK